MKKIIPIAFFFLFLFSLNLLSAFIQQGTASEHFELSTSSGTVTYLPLNASWLHSVDNLQIYINNTYWVPTYNSSSGLSGGPRTFCGWINTSSSSKSIVTSTNNLFAIEIYKGNFSVSSDYNGFSNYITYTTSKIANDSLWHNFCYTFNQTNCSSSFNCKTTTTVYADNINYGGVELNPDGGIGVYPYIYGPIDELIVFGKVLNDSEIQAVYEQGRRTNITIINPLAILDYFPFNEGSGTYTKDLKNLSRRSTLTNPVWKNDSIFVMNKSYAVNITIANISNALIFWDNYTLINQSETSNRTFTFYNNQTIYILENYLINENSPLPNSPISIVNTGITNKKKILTNNLDKTINGTVFINSNGINCSKTDNVTYITNSNLITNWTNASAVTACNDFITGKILSIENGNNLLFLGEIGLRFSISVIYPTGNINVQKNTFFNVTLNISCGKVSCGEINISLDPFPVEYTKIQGFDNLFLNNGNEYIIELENTPLIKYNPHQFFLLKYIGLDSYVNQKNRIKVEQNKLIKNIRSKINTFNVKKEYNTLLNAVVLEIDQRDLNTIKELPNIKAIYENKEVHVMLQDSIPLINATEVYTLKNSSGSDINGSGIVVAVIDTGINYTHKDFGNCNQTDFVINNCSRFIGGYDYVNDDNNPMDDYGHGTHVAGIIGASGEINGVAQGVKFLVYKALSSYGSGYTTDIISSIEDAVANNSDIISMSLGSMGYSDSVFSTVIKNAVDAGVVVVIAAGNDGAYGYFTTDSPGADLNAITVGAVDKNNTLAYFSSRGFAMYSNGSVAGIKPDILAYGAYINSTNYTGSYEEMSGTSMATPMVSGIVALIKQGHPTWTVNQIKSALSNSAKDLGYNPLEQGSGLVNAFDSYNISGIVTPNNFFVYGHINISTRYVNYTRYLNITNLANRTIGYNLSIEFSEDGISTNLSNYTLILNSGEDYYFNITFMVDSHIMEADTYYGKIRVISSENQNYTVPFVVSIWNDYLKGLVSTSIGAYPFYTTDSNPTTINLNANESEEIVFNVVPTGDTNATYRFFAFGESNESLILSSTWNITILYNPINPIYDNLIDNNGTINNTGTAKFNATINGAYPIYDSEYLSGVGLNYNNHDYTVNLSNNNWVDINNDLMYSIMSPRGYYGDSFTSSIWFKTKLSNVSYLVYQASHYSISLINNDTIFIDTQNTWYNKSARNDTHLNATWNYSSGLGDDEWHNLVVNWNNTAGNLSLWIDGNIVNSSINTSFLCNVWAASTIFLGTYFPISYDDFRLYYAFPINFPGGYSGLSDESIIQLYNNGRNNNLTFIPQTNNYLAVHWTFDEGNGLYTYNQNRRPIDADKLQDDASFYYGVEEWGGITQNYSLDIPASGAGTYPYYWFSYKEDGTTTNSSSKNYTILGDPDTNYPIFSNKEDNNGTLGTGQFNITVSSTNGTVYFYLGTIRHKTTNVSNVYSFSTGEYLTAGFYYDYYWTAYGNGSTHLQNDSLTYQYQRQSNDFIYENNTGTLNSVSPIYTNYSQSQVFTVGGVGINETFNISRITLYLTAYNLPIDCNVSMSIRNSSMTSNDYAYSMNNVSSLDIPAYPTANLVQFKFANYSVQAGQSYSFVLRSDGCDSSSYPSIGRTSHTYLNKRYYSTDDLNWTQGTYYLNFAIRGYGDTNITGTPLPPVSPTAVVLDAYATAGYTILKLIIPGVLLLVIIGYIAIRKFELTVKEIIILAIGIIVDVILVQYSINGLN